VGRQKYPEVSGYLYSFFWNHIVKKTRSLHLASVLIHYIQKQENERAMLGATLVANIVNATSPQHGAFIFWILNTGDQYIHVKTLFSLQCGSRKGCTGTFGPRGKVPAAAHRGIGPYVNLLEGPSYAANKSSLEALRNGFPNILKKRRIFWKY
jgi:hypothetical protein